MHTKTCGTLNSVALSIWLSIWLSRNYQGQCQSVIKLIFVTIIYETLRHTSPRTKQLWQITAKTVISRYSLT
jgi:hypothetical protein